MHRISGVFYISLSIELGAGSNRHFAVMHRHVIDGGILPADFDEKMSHPLQFLEQMALFPCFYSLFTELSLKIH